MKRMVSKKKVGRSTRKREGEGGRGWEQQRGPLSFSSPLLLEAMTAGSVLTHMTKVRWSKLKAA